MSTHPKLPHTVVNPLSTSYPGIDAQRAYLFPNKLLFFFFSLPSPLPGSEPDSDLLEGCLITSGMPSSTIRGASPFRNEAAPMARTKCRCVASIWSSRVNLCDVFTDTPLDEISNPLDFNDSFVELNPSFMVFTTKMIPKMMPPKIRIVIARENTSVQVAIPTKLYVANPSSRDQSMFGLFQNLCVVERALYTDSVAWWREKDGVRKTNVRS